MSLRAFILRSAGLLIAVVVAARLSAADTAAFAPSELDRAPSEFSYEFTAGDLAWKTSGPFTGWTKNFRRNPIPYRTTFTAVSVSHPVRARRAFWRKFEYVHSAIWSGITRGPENHWAGLATGLRYHQPLPARLHTSLFASFQGGVGGIDASGQKYAQAKDLTFAYIAAAGFRTRISDSIAVHVQVLGQHISNGWQTRPSEGIDCAGWAFSVSYRPRR